MTGYFDWLISVALLIEYEDVLNRLEHRAVTGMSVRDVDEFLDNVLLHARQVILGDFDATYMPDANDGHVLSLAVQGAADGIVTNNIKHFRIPAMFYGVSLYTPSQALALVRN